ncbi:ABC transporter permease [Gordonia zhaorongruii]|uniref:ABC transporter permease n=1 Tax=Gordonia zhaorongruii TaxID=2597659 RepID=UPI001049E4C3|nr:ABC transporter permease [Gordonia zhaorongruii]
MPASDLIPTVVSVVALAVIAVAVLRWYDVPQRWAPGWALVRAAGQLAVVSAALAGVITHPGLVAVGVGVMYAVAVGTATMRLSTRWNRLRVATLVAGAVAAGVGTALTVVFASGALDFDVRYVLAMAGIVIGNTMNTATLTGRRLSEGVLERWDEVEAWLALGAAPRQATASIARLAVHSALVPSVDQAKTTGLVTLPGAFVGAIFGGLSPIDAGRFQLLVIAALMASGAIASVTVSWFMAPVRTKPVPVDSVTVDPVTASWSARRRRTSRQ